MYAHRDEVMRRLEAMVEYVENRDVVLVHENESAHLRRDGQGVPGHPADGELAEAAERVRFRQLRPGRAEPEELLEAAQAYTVHIHVKDALFDGGKVVPAGQGDGAIPRLLEDAWKSGYRGFLTLEPHLAHAGQFAGFTGPDSFKVAVDALKKICTEKNIPLASLRACLQSAPNPSPSKRYYHCTVARLKGRRSCGDS